MDLETEAVENLEQSLPEGPGIQEPCLDVSRAYPELC